MRAIGCIWVEHHFNSEGHIMAVGDAHAFHGFLSPVLTQLFFPKPPTTFLTCFCRGERRKYAGKKVCNNRGSNSQPPGHESDTLTTEPRGRKIRVTWQVLTCTILMGVLCFISKNIKHCFFQNLENLQNKTKNK